MERTDGQGVRLRYAQLDGAVLGQAKLTGANLSNADLEDADLSGAVLRSANLSRATLRGADMTQAQLEQANMSRVVAVGTILVKAMMNEAVLREADLTGARLKSCDLSGADLRRAVLVDGELDDLILTGAKIHGLDTGSTFPDSIVAEWADAGARGDGTRLLDIRQIRAMLAGVVEGAQTRQRRYFGHGDVLRNAQLDFREGATVHVESEFENCAIVLSSDAELVLGEKGKMNDCTIQGGRLTLHGRFTEGSKTGLVEPRRLVVSSTAVVQTTVKQPDSATEFAFERGCRLRLNIERARSKS
jgi:hypothetical protein